MRQTRWENNIEMDFIKMWTGFIWLRIETSSRIL
jgi:hypothetical protein